MSWIRPRLTYANVVSSIALFGVLAAGGAYAASKIGSNDIKKNAVKSRHIDGKAVKTTDIARGAVTRGRLVDAEPVHIVGDPGQPEFTQGWSTVAGEEAGFYKDLMGVVHMTGAAQAVAGQEPGLVMFTLPPAYRPAEGTCIASTRFFEEAPGESVLDAVQICPQPNGDVRIGAVGTTDATQVFSLGGITFRAG